MRLIGRLLDASTSVVTLAGSVIVLVMALWITYGVFVRYVLKDPDRMVTEATALLLVPLAFVGLPYALKQDAFPKVTMLVDLLPQGVRTIIELINHVLVVSVGVFYAIVTTSAAMRTYASGSASEILLWPRFAFWTPVAICIVIFTGLAVLRLFSLIHSAKSQR